MTGDRHVTRDVEPAALRTLLERPPRATVAFARDGVPDAVAARVRADASRVRFAIVADGAPDLTGREVVVLIDAGADWFHLRGMSFRGVAMPSDADGEGLVGYELTPRRVLAWDYGTIREE